MKKAIKTTLSMIAFILVLFFLFDGMIQNKEDLAIVNSQDFPRKILQAQTQSTKQFIVMDESESKKSNTWSLLFTNVSIAIGFLILLQLLQKTRSKEKTQANKDILLLSYLDNIIIITSLSIIFFLGWTIYIALSL